MDTDDGIDTRRFLTDLYRVFLEREPDSDALTPQLALLEAGHSLGDLVAAFTRSEAFDARRRREMLVEYAAMQIGRTSISSHEHPIAAHPRFPADHAPPGEAGRSYLHRLHSGFLDLYCAGETILDVGFSGYDNPLRKTALPGAIGIDLDYPGYDGRTLPFADGSVDTVFSSHCLEHIPDDIGAIRDWFRVLKVGGFIVCMVPSQALYEKKRDLPSNFNADHKRMYTPASFLASFEAALEVNHYRLRHFCENDRDFNYAIGPDAHSDGAYEIELVIEKIAPPDWELA